jgi:hypothetical protein
MPATIGTNSTAIAKAMINQALQWSGTVALLTMYVLMSFAPHLHPWNIVAGLVGGLCYGAWTIRVSNRPQMIVNAVAITIGLAGLYRAWS